MSRTTEELSVFLCLNLLNLNLGLNTQKWLVVTVLDSTSLEEANTWIRDEI